jgi:predicted transport protein
VTDIKLFALDAGSAKEILGSATTLEKSLQNLIERNLEAILNIRLLGSEYSTGPKHGGRIDTLGIDENASPVIIEYKRATNQNVINQGLFYLDWLLDHQAEFKLLVLDKLDADVAKTIDWTAPRLLCVAGGFTRYDEHAVEQMNRNIELIRYRRFGKDLLMLELVNATVAEPGPSIDGETGPSSPSYKTISVILTELDDLLADLYQALRAHLNALGDDVQEKTLKYYVAFKRLQNFACVEVHPSKGAITVFLKVDPDTITLKQGFSRDVRTIGHYGTGDLEITIRSWKDFERAKPLLQTSYEAS